MPIKPVEIPHFQHAVSLRQQTAGYYRNSTNQSIGIANVWSVATWVKPVSNPGSGDTFFVIRPTASNINRILLTGTATAGQLGIIISTSGGATIKDYKFNDGYVAGNWVHWVFTWDGTTLLFYKNGVLTSPDTLTTDNSGTMTSNNRSVGFGAQVSGSNVTDACLHSAAVWSAVVTAAEASLLYNDGNGCTFDVRTIQPTKLEHWWLVGRGDSTSGKDYGTGTATKIDISTNALINVPSVPQTKHINDVPRKNFNQGPGKFTGHKYCLDFPGSFEKITSQARAIQLVNDWTVGIWWKPTKSSYTASEILFTAGQNGATQSNISFQIQGAIANDPIDVITKNTIAANLKQYRYDNIPNTTQSWQHWVATWDGTTLTLYNNGTALVADSKVVDQTSSMSDDTARVISIGNNSSGGSPCQCRVHSAVMYDRCLTAGEAASLYNDGNGWSFDCSTIANLRHWFLLGDPNMWGGYAYDRIDTAINQSIDLTSAMSSALKGGTVDYPGI